ncbi:hypothetical protein [Streptomyces murinus]
MPRTTYTPSLPGLSAADDDLDTIINWGAGADSSAYIAKMLTAPDAHGIDLDRTAILYMATGSEWPETRLLADEFMIPLLRENGVRFVQLARNGHLQSDGFTILDDSRHPEQLIARGPWTLWDDQESVGTVTPEKSPAAQHALPVVPVHRPAAAPEGQLPLFVSGPEERGGGEAP